MRKPFAPFLEFSFYFANKSDSEAFKNLVETLTRLGAKFVGNGLAIIGQNSNKQPFAGIFDTINSEIEIRNIADFYLTIEDPNKRVTQIFIEGATSTTTNVAEIVTYLSIPDSVIEVDHHPLAIWTDGSIFSSPIMQKNPRQVKLQEQKASRIGLLAYKRFITILKRIKPTYAAITIEGAVESPTILQEDPRSNAFHNFYLSNDFFSQRNLSKILKLYEGAYIEELENGVYISINNNFNPDDKKINPNEGYLLSIEVAKIVGNQFFKG